VKRPSGAFRIFLYNAPVFVTTWAFALVFAAAAATSVLPLRGLLFVAAAGAVLWSIVALGVSAYVYDWSALSGGAWLPPLVGDAARGWAAIHAGLDAEIDLGALPPDGCVGRLDIFEPAVMTSPSIARARQTTAAGPATPSRATALALADESCSAIVVAFTAHEIRDAGARERFFLELRRALRPGGRALLVEHVRDAANFLAFGPGFVHFLPRKEWLRLAEEAGLAVVDERRITPWVMALTMERPA
jgi:hypothetical protein